METFSFDQRPAPPKLVFRQGTCRRDSIVSSKTADSGYNSDPEVSLSPLEFLGPGLDFVNEETSSSPHEVPLITLETPAFQFRSAAISPTPANWQKNRRGKATTRSLSHPDGGPTSAPSLETRTKLDWYGTMDGPSYDAKMYYRTNPFIDNSHDPKAIKTAGDGIHECEYPVEGPKERVGSIVSLSSTGSGGDYSVTDDSEYEEAPVHNTMLSKATIATIDLVVRKIELQLNYAAYIQCAGAPSSRGPSTTRGHAPGPTSSSRRGSVQGSNGKRRARGEDSLQPEERDDDGPSKRRRVSITTTEDSETGPRFACPFYKHDPDRYRNRRTCPGPGWPTVHRMKEHLYRSHAQPIFCPRCYTMFDADSDLSNHLRSDPCQISAPQPIEGIDRETLSLLRKRSSPHRLEEDKWRDTYQVLFPAVPEADIPSPYYDGDSPTEESRRFRRELLRRIQEELIRTAERETGPVEQNLLRQVAEIIQRCENELLNSLRPSATASPVPAPAVSRDPVTEVRASNSASWPPSSNPIGNPSMLARNAPSRVIPRIYTPMPDQSFSTSQSRNTSPGVSFQPPPAAWDYADLIDWNAVFPVGGERSDLMALPSPSNTMGMHHAVGLVGKGDGA